jgi:hypothetical protein
MSDFCPHCDDFSMDASRATRTDNHEAKEKPKKKASKPKQGNGNKITINVDSSDENADWIKRVRDEEVEEQSIDGADRQSDRDSHPT